MSPLGGKQVLITGAGGFIGSHLVERLIQLGAKVRAFVRYTSRPQAGFLDELPPQVRSSVEVERGDLRDFNAVLDAAKGVDVILHLGALVGIPYSYLHPRETIETNVLGTLNVLLASRIQDVGRVIHASSSEVYGSARVVPIDEGHPLQGQSPYSASKIAADKICESFFDSYGLSLVTMRPFNTYGPRQSARAVIPTIITQALMGEEVSLGSLWPKRDFCYVTDTAEGFVKAAECEAAVGRTINLGTSAEVSVQDLVDKVGVILGKKIRVCKEENRQRPMSSEVERLVSDNTLARQLLGWQPCVSLDEGLDRTVKWVRDNLHMYRAGRYEI